MHMRDTKQNTKIKCSQQLDSITCTNITIQTRLQYAQTYQYEHRYNIHKHININKYIIRVQWQNKSFTRNIYNKITKTSQTCGKYFVKCADIPNITQIQLLLRTNKPPQYLQLIPHIITEYLMKELLLLPMLLFYFRCHISEKSLVGHRD